MLNLNGELVGDFKIKIVKNHFNIVCSFGIIQLKNIYIVGVFF